MRLCQRLPDHSLVKFQETGISPPTFFVSANCAEGPLWQRKIDDIQSFQLESQYGRIEWRIVSDKNRAPFEELAQLRQEFRECWLPDELVVGDAGDLGDLGGDLLSGVDELAQFADDAAVL